MKNGVKKDYTFNKLPVRNIMIKRKILIITALFFMSCSTADIAVNKNAVDSINLIAIAPFTSSYIIDPEIYKESEEFFASAFTRLGYKVSNLNSVLPEKEENRLTLREKEINRLKSKAEESGADVLLFGRIIFHEKSTRTVFSHAPLVLRRYAFFDADDRIKTVTEFKFQIHITVLKLSDDTVILDIKNRYPRAEKDEYMPAFNSLDAYRKYTLKKMADELEKKLSAGK
jgi:hypothetical protein